MISILQEKKEEGTRSPAIGLSRSLYSENLNFLAPSGCPDWPFSLILFFPPSFTLCFGMGFLLPPPLFSCHCLSHRLWSEWTGSLSAWGAVRGNEWTLGASLAELRSAFWEEWLLGCQTEAVTTETWHRYVWETTWCKSSCGQFSNPFSFWTWDDYCHQCFSVSVSLMYTFYSADTCIWVKHIVLCSAMLFYTTL